MVSALCFARHAGENLSRSGGRVERGGLLNRGKLAHGCTKRKEMHSSSNRYWIRSPSLTKWH